MQLSYSLSNQEKVAGVVINKNYGIFCRLVAGIAKLAPITNMFLKMEQLARNVLLVKNQMRERLAAFLWK